MAKSALWSHHVWRFRDRVIGMEASRNGCGWKKIKDVIISPNGNAYAVVYEDGTMDDMSTYDDIYIR